MTVIHCPYCDKFDRALFIALERCQACDADLVARVKEREDGPVRRALAFIAHPTELDYATTPVERTDLPIEHSAQELLEYAIGLLQATRLVLEADVEQRALILGFLTGSADLIWLLRRRYGLRFEDRVRLTPGLRTPGAAEQLAAILDAASQAGRSTIVVVDEVVSGTQMRTDLAAIDSWASTRGVVNQLRVRLVGMREAGAPKSDDEMRSAITRSSQKYSFTLPDVDVKFVTVPRLLAKDTEGRPLKGVWGGGAVPHAADRIWPGGYRIRCENQLSFEGCANLEVVSSKGSLDQIFGSLIWEICGFAKTDKPGWPGSILARGCGVCRSRLDEARKIAKALPEPPVDNDAQTGTIVASYNDGRWIQHGFRRLLGNAQELADWWSRKR